MLAIGLKGGVELARQPLPALAPQVLAVILSGLALPLIALPVPCGIGRLGRGCARRGVRAAHQDTDRSIRMDIICDAVTAEAIGAYVREHNFSNYAMSLHTDDIAVLRPEKFCFPAPLAINRATGF